MPKAQKHVAEAQKQRIKIKERLSKYVPGKVTLQVLGTGAQGAPRSLYVFSDQSRYLFNCGEGTQRLAHEHKMKLAKLEHIFVTQAVWKNMGGLPGTALTIQDVGVPEITLHGPKGLDELFRATKRFVVIKNLHLKMADCMEGETFEDNVMKVTYVPLKKTQALGQETEFYSSASVSDESEYSDLDRSSELDKSLQAGASTNTMDAFTSTKQSKRRRKSKNRSMSLNSEEIDDITDYYSHERKRSRNRGRRRSRSLSVSGQRTAPQLISEETKISLTKTKEAGMVMSYVCRLQPRPGALNLDKCVKFGVPAGPLLGTLKNGTDITLQNGNVVRAQDVCEPDDPGPVIIIIDCPSEEYLNALVDSDILRQHQAQAVKDEDFAYLVVHFTPSHIINHTRYKNWINEFSPSTQHLLLNDSNTCMGSESVHRIQQKLNLLNDNFFPLLGDHGSKITRHSPKRAKLDLGDEENDVDDLDDKNRPKETDLNHYIHPNTFCSFHLRPRKGFDNSTELRLDPDEYIQETLAVTGFQTTLQVLKRNLTLAQEDMSIRHYPRVLFLGTGSCIPNKTRNTSGILLETSENSNIIVDCGEGTYGQIVRFFGKEKSATVLANVNAIYVSHLHADHHIGLIGLLQGRRMARQLLHLPNKPVYLFAPLQIMTWLNFYDLCFEDISSEYDLISNGDLMKDKQKLQQSQKSETFENLNMTDISTVHVRHCPNAYGVAFTHKLGYKVTYSGDTMPCDDLIELGMDSDLLIHEATMEDELAHEAIIKMHSTTSQAIKVGRRMRAKHIILTHFSQRYAKLPRFNENFTENIGIAFDNMQVRLDELPLVPLLYPALKLMFAEHYEELEHKAVKRQLRIEKTKEVVRERQLSQERQKSEKRPPSIDRSQR